jgi:hypothetical protein
MIRRGTLERRLADDTEDTLTSLHGYLSST